MTLIYGVLDEGFFAKPLPVVESQIDTGLKKILGDSAGTEPDGTIPPESAAGQLKVLLVDGFAEQWDLQLAVYASRDPNQATGASQDAICALNGTLREAEAFSLVTETCVGTPGTLLLAGRTVKVSTSGAVFVSKADGTITLLSSWAALASYAVGDRVTNSGKAYQCITAGVSAASGGPTTTSANITDGTAHWKYLGTGTGAVDIAFRSSVVGPIGALAGLLAEITTPVSGWAAALNLLDAIPGREAESNALLRARREARLAAIGNTTERAITANILEVNQGSADPLHLPPTSCRVFINDTDYTNGDGLPPHSIEVMIQGGTDADLAQAIWDSVGAGTATFGNQTSSVVDSQGNPQTVHWTRPVEVPIYLDITLGYDARVWPGADPSAAIEQAVLSALLTAREDFPIAFDVRGTPISGEILRGPSQVDTDGLAIVPAAETAPPVPGLLEATPILISKTPGPSSPATVAIGLREVATFDSSRITITAVAEDP